MNKSFITRVLLIISGLNVCSVSAAEWSLTSTLAPSFNYDDNVFMSENEQGSVQYLLSPTLSIKRALETSEIDLSVGYNINRYVSFSELDRQDPFARLNSTFSTERSNYGLAASYQQSSSRSTAEEDTGDFTTESSLTTETISPSYSYQLTERNLLSIGGSYSTRTYSTTDFSDNEIKSLNSGWQHQFSERLSGGLTASVSNYQSDGVTGTTDDDNYSLSTTMTYRLSELWQVNGQLGIRKLNSRNTDNVGFTQSNSSSGSSFNFNARRQSELGLFSVGLSRSLSPSSTGDVNEQDRFNVSWSRELTEQLSTSMSASYQQSTSAIDEGSSDERENINFSPAIKWQFDRNLGLNVGYNYRQQKESEENTNVSSNSVMATLIYDWDGIRASR